jgi:choline transport protein
MQYVIGFFTAIFYLIAIFYSISSIEDVLDSDFLFPLTEIYLQTTGSSAGSLGLLIVAFLPLLVAVMGCYLTASRMFWTLARDNATPFSGFFGQIHSKHRNPFNSIVLCGTITTCMGCIYVGSLTAFSAFVSSFAVLTMISYTAAILPHLLTRRSTVQPGWFWMKGISGYVVNTISCGFMLVFIVLFCFPFAMPFDAAEMNYTSLITGGLTIFVTVWWFIRQGSYEGPHFVPLESSMLAADAI